MISQAQTNRMMSLDTPLGPDALSVESVSGHEALGRLFRYEMNLLSDRADISIADLLGTSVTLTIRDDQQPARHLNGIVSHARLYGEKDDLTRYAITVVPWLWLLTQSIGCRIFQHMTVPEMIDQVFSELTGASYRSRLTSTYRTRDYCVQYRESVFDFLSRLMEQEGITYFFEHEEDAHRLVLSDSPSAFDTIDGHAAIPFFPESSSPRHDAHIWGWTSAGEAHPAMVTLQDYDFRSPRKQLEHRVSAPDRLAMPGFEVYDYPGEYAESTDGEHYVRVRNEQLTAEHHTAGGSTDLRKMCVGATFRLTDPNGLLRDDQQDEYLVTRCEFRLEQDALRSGLCRGRPEFTCDFAALPVRVPYRPRLVTSSPLIAGPQTATVTGPPDEEIWTDEYGRVKVQFHWDRAGLHDDTSSCWIRVSQPSAGAAWGAMFLPRVGQEVIIDFLEGDPDRPIITGRVYNGSNQTPYELPEHKTVSGFVSDTHKGRGANELRFQDAADKEQVLLRAQRDLDITVCNTARERVYGDKHIVVGWDKDGERGGDLLEQVNQDHHRTVYRDDAQHIHGNQSVLIGKGDAEGGRMELVVENDRRTRIEANDELAILGDRNTSVDGSQSLNVTGDRSEETAGNLMLNTGGEMFARSYGKMVLEAANDLTIKAGGSYIRISDAGITINGTMVWVNSSAGQVAESGTYIESSSALQAIDAETSEPSVADGGTSNRHP